MKYPYLKKEIIKQEITDGGIKMLFLDMILFTFRVAIIIFLFEISLFAWSSALNDVIFKNISRECANEISQLVNK